MNRTIPLSAAVCALALVLGGCADQKKTTKKQAPTPAQAALPAAPYVEKLSADALFAFGKADLSGFSDTGRAELDAIAAKALSGSLAMVNVIGHSDRIGNDAANVALSTRRANAVRQYLIQRGIPAQKITAVGRGSVEPVVECKDARKQALIACLAPNRRVEVRVEPGY
jgi:OOP family OmpA-OmpF porin